MYKSKFNDHLKEFDAARKRREAKEAYEQAMAKRIELGLSIDHVKLQTKLTGYSLMRENYIRNCEMIARFVEAYKRGDYDDRNM